MPQPQNAQLPNREGKIHHALSAYTTCQFQSLRRAAEVFHIAAIERLGHGEHFSYRKVAEQFNIQHSTLRRRYQGLCAPRAGEAQNRQKLSPQQELQLVRYIEDLTERELPPTRAMIRNFGGDIAGMACSDAWVSRFLRRNKHLLTSKWTSGMDRDHHKADSKDKYEAYFDLLHSKIREYKVEPENIYNMDEKGFLMSITGCSKRVFSKQFWEQKRVTAAVQDGSREWICQIQRRTTLWEITLS
jgi:hypothetical protein